MKTLLLILILTFTFSAFGQNTSADCDKLQDRKQELESQKRQLQTRYTDDYAEIISINSQVAEIEKQIKVKCNQIEVSPAMRELLKQKAALNEKLQNLLKQFKEKHPDVVETKTAIEKVDKQIFEVRAGTRQAEAQIEASLRSSDYAIVVRNPVLLKVLVEIISETYTEMRVNAVSAPQVSQAADETNVKLNFIIVAQNQRIIELLEQAAKKKP